MPITGLRLCSPIAAERIGDAPRPVRIERRGEVERHGERVAVDVEPERRGQRGRMLAETQRHGDGEWGQHVRGLHLAIDEAVTQRRPAFGANQREVDALRIRKAFLLRRNQHGAVGERQIGGGDPHHAPPPNRSLAVMSASATSTMRRPWFIAVERSSA